MLKYFTIILTVYNYRLFLNNLEVKLNWPSPTLIPMFSTYILKKSRAGYTYKGMCNN